MKTVGLFVGLSAHEDPLVPSLRHGHHDAQALHALFADANEQVGSDDANLRLLTNEHATVANVSDALSQVSAAANDADVQLFVVHFSCHGGASGELVLHDTRIGALAETGLPVAEVVDGLTVGNSATVVLSLDCCFSGAVLGMSDSPNREAFDRLMGRFTGDSRFVVWAAEPGQEAYEDLSLAHGYLSAALLNGIASARARGLPTIRIATWLSEAASEVGQLAERAGRVQQAGCYAMLTSPATLVIPAVGWRERQFAEQRGVVSISAELSSLSIYGFDEAELTAIRTRLNGATTLNQLQQDAVAPAGVLAGRSILVRAPTSAGKTLIAELAMLKQRKAGRKTVFLLPLRALVDEQANSFREHYGSQLNVRIIVSTGEIADDDDLLIRNHYDVALLTYEKFIALIGVQPRLIEDIGLVVFDEIQVIESGQRGRVLELLLVRLRRLQRLRAWPQLIVLAGELANIHPLQAWLGLEPVGSAVRPVPLHQGVVQPDGTARMLVHGSTNESAHRFPELPSSPMEHHTVRWPNDERANLAASLAARMVQKEGKQVLAFCTSRPSAIRLARWLADRVSMPAIPTLATPETDLDAGDRHRATDILAEVSNRGVAFHIADLNRGERQRVEAAFRSGQLRALVATPTLAMGVNFPTDVVLIVDHSFFQGDTASDVPLTLATYRNMAGRAGRLIHGGPREGTALLISGSSYEQRVLWDRYLAGQAAPLQSSLDELAAEDLALALLLLRSEASPVELAEDLADTYWGFTQEDRDNWSRTERKRLEIALEDLTRDGFALSVAPGRWTLTSVGRMTAVFGFCAESGRRIRYAAKVIKEQGETIDSFTLLGFVQLMVEMDNLLMPRGSTPVTARPPLFDGRQTLWSLLTAPEGHVAPPKREMLGNRLHRMIALLYWGKGKAMKEVERIYARDVDSRTPVASLFRNMLDRTSDFLPGVAAVLLCDHPELREQLRGLVPLLRSQLAVGGNAIAGQLFSLRVGLTRGECRALMGIGVDASNIHEAVRTRFSAIEAAISTPRALELRGHLNDARLARRNTEQNQSVILHELGSDTVF